MKVKDWINELEKLDPEQELYFHQRGLTGADWGYIITHPTFETQRLEKIVRMTIGLIYPEQGRKKAKPLGECATFKMDWF